MESWLDPSLIDVILTLVTQLIGTKATAIFSRLSNLLHVRFIITTSTPLPWLRLPRFHLWNSLYTSKLISMECAEDACLADHNQVEAKDLIQNHLVNQNNNGVFISRTPKNI